jgi:hypothetical protein
MCSGRPAHDPDKGDHQISQSHSRFTARLRIAFLPVLAFAVFPSILVQFAAALKKISLFKWGWMEARVGIEPTYKGFADLSLTTWVPRPETTV